MFVYNITLNMDMAIESEVLIWIKETFIPLVMKEGLFHEFQLCKLQFTDQDTPAYAIQFYCSDENEKNKLLHPTDSKYLDWVNDQYGLKVMPFASILDILEPAYLSFIHKN
jgi:Domain of unknown function (DUF4286)